MNKKGREVSIVFAGFSVNDTDKLIRKMSERLKLKPGCSMFLPEKYFCEDKTVCHSYFTDENGGVKKGGYFMSGSAEMIIAANDSDAVRNISWLKTEGTIIIYDKNHNGEMSDEKSIKMREFLKKQEEYGFVRTIIH